MKTPQINIKALLVVVSVLIIAVISSSQYYLQNRVNKEISNSFEEETVELLKSLNAIFVFAVSIEDRESVQQIADSIVKNNYIYTLEVRSESGDILASSVNSKLSEIRELQVIPYEFSIVDTRNVSLSPFEDDETQKVVGSIKVLLTRHKTNLMLSAVMSDTILVVVFCIIFVLLLIALLGQTITRNFSKASKALQSIGSEHFKAIESVSLIKEFNQLNSRLNEIGDKTEVALKELRKSDSFKRNLISMVSHDLRTPVNTIAPLVELMLDMAEADNPDSIFYDHLKICRDSTKVLKSILDQLLEFGEVETAELQYKEKQFSPEILFDVIYNVFKSKIDSSIKFTVVAEKHSQTIPASYFIATDEGKLTRILTNLLENSVKYTNSGSITLSWWLDTQLDKSFLVFRVEDTGIGIADESLPHIFDEYYKADQQSSGWGIGLSLVRKFIEVMKGNVVVDSVLSKGTKITVRLPVTLSLIEESGVSDDVSCHIVVVDDNRNNCYVMENLLLSMGIESKTFTNPEEALISQEIRECDAIFVDYAMPEMTGVSFAAAARNTGITEPIVCVTAHIEHDIISEIYQSIRDDAGITHVMKKPIGKRELNSTILSILKTKDLVNKALKDLSQD